MQVSSTQKEGSASRGSHEAGHPETGAAPDSDRRASDDRINLAYRSAQSLEIAHLGELDNTSSFERLKQFGAAAFHSALDVRAFRDLMQQHPEQLGDLKTWYADAAKKSAWAHDRMLDDPFERTPNLPVAPQDYTTIALTSQQGAAADKEALTRLNAATKRIADNEAMYHAASQNGPIKQAYLAQHTPPKPLWQQQTEDVVGRFLVGAIPGVNLFVNQIVPARSLSNAWRQGVDMLSGIAGGIMGAAAATAGGRMAGALGSEVSDPMGLGGSEAIGGVAGRLGKTRGANREPRVTSSVSPATAATIPPPKPASVANAEHASQSHGRPIEGAKGGTSTSPPHKREPVQPASIGHQGDAFRPDAGHPGIWRDKAGKPFIQRAGTFQQAGYDALNGTWWARTTPSQPVRLNAQGYWEKHDDVGLRGGMPRGSGGTAMSSANRSIRACSDGNPARGSPRN